MNSEKSQGLGNWHITQKEDTERRILNYLTEIDESAIDDSSRSMRAIHRATRIELKTLSIRLKNMLGKKILEIKGKKRRRLFCIQSNRNKLRTQEYETTFQSISRKPSKIQNLKNFKLSAKRHLALTQQLMEICNILVERENPDTNSSKKHTELVELFKVIRDTFYNQLPTLEMYLDGRQKQFPQMEPFLLALSSLTSKNDICKNYFPIISEKLSPPLEKYIQLSKIRSHLDFIKFVQDDPLMWGFWEIKCPSCGKYALERKTYLNGKWDIICTNWDVHEKGNEPHYSVELLTRWLEDLRTNKDEAATKYLKRHGIKVPY